MGTRVNDRATDECRAAVEAAERNGALPVKSPGEIEAMRRAGRVVREVLDRLCEQIHPGVSTTTLDGIAAKCMADRGAEPLFRGVRNRQAAKPFPACICASVNEELVHGIPGGRDLREGDILTVDCGVRLDGYCADSAVTVPVGTVSAEAGRLLMVARGALEYAVELIQPGRMWSEVAREMQAYVEDEGFSVIRDFVGHGIGKNMHEQPKVPNYWDDARRCPDFMLVPNLVIAVEPMVAAGNPGVEYRDDDRWVVVMKDRSLCAHFEHTVAVTDTGAEVLTL